MIPLKCSTQYLYLVKTPTVHVLMYSWCFTEIKRINELFLMQSTMERPDPAFG